MVSYSLAHFTEMIDYVTEFCKKDDQELTIDERNILSVAFKNAVGTRRAAWRVISLIERKEKNKGATQNAEKAAKYKQVIEQELTSRCKNILDLLNLTLLKNVKTVEGEVFLQKLKGDYYRYIAEFAHGE